MAKQKKKTTDPKDFLYTKKSGWEGINRAEKKKIMDFSIGYRKFLDDAKTEREAVKTIEALAKKEGYVNIETAKKTDKKLFINFDNVACVLADIGDMNFEKGFLMVGAHIDAPRLDLKGCPLFEAEDMAFMKTHYYGGIKAKRCLKKKAG